MTSSIRDDAVETYDRMNLQDAEIGVSLDFVRGRKSGEVKTYTVRLTEKSIA